VFDSLSRHKCIADDRSKNCSVCSCPTFVSSPFKQSIVSELEKKENHSLVEATVD
jgi:hypothetical protein